MRPVEIGEANLGRSEVRGIGRPVQQDGDNGPGHGRLSESSLAFHPTFAGPLAFGAIKCSSQLCRAMPWHRGSLEVGSLKWLAERWC